MGTKTIHIKKNPPLFDYVTDSFDLYYVYESKEESSEAYISAPKALALLTEIQPSKITCKEKDTSELPDRDDDSSLSKVPDDTVFHVCFSDGSDVMNDVAVDKAVFIEHLRFMLEDERYRKEYRSHENLFVDLSSLEAITATPDISLEELALKKDISLRLGHALKSLTPLQRKRLILRFVLEKTIREIGDEENVDHANVIRSIKRALNRLRRMLDDV